MTDGSFPFDVTFTIDGTIYGYMMASPDGESKQTIINEAGAPNAERLSTRDEASYTDYEPTVDTPFVMTDFSGGIGDLEYEPSANKYLWGNMVTHVPNKVYLPNAAATEDVGSEAGDLNGFYTYLHTDGTRYDFTWTAGKLYRRDASNATNNWTLVYTASNSKDIGDFKIADGIGLISVPEEEDTNSVDFYTQADVTAAATWSPTTRDHTAFSDANGRPKYWQVVRGTTYAIVDNNKVFYTVDPTADSWVGPIDTNLTGNISGPPGDDTYPFIGSIAVNDFLFVVKKDAIYSIDSQQDVLEVIWQWKEQPSNDNFRYFTAAADQLAYSVNNEVYIYDPISGLNNPMGLSRQSGFSTKKILGLSGDNRYLYILAQVRVNGVRSADSIALIRAYKLTGVRWGFECLWEDTTIGNDSYHRVFVAPAGSNTHRVYWGLNRNSGNTTTYIMDNGNEWDESAGSNFTSSGSLWTSLNDSNFPGFTKRHLYINMESEDTDANNTIVSYYSTDRGANYSLIGTNNDGTFEANYSDVNSTIFGLRFDFTSNDGSQSPVLRNFDHHQRVRFKYLPSHVMKLRIANNIELRGGAWSNLPVDQLWTNLVTIRTTNDDILYKDFLGNSYNVSVDLLELQLVQHEAIGEWELEATIRITEATRGQ